MVSGSLCLTSFINVESHVSLVVIGQQPRRGRWPLPKRKGAIEAAWRASGGAGRVSERAGWASDGAGRVRQFRCPGIREVSASTGSNTFKYHTMIITKYYESLAVRNTSAPIWWHAPKTALRGATPKNALILSCIIFLKLAYKKTLITKISLKNL